MKSKATLQSVRAWCSWCGKCVVHQLVSENRVERDEYQCQHCGNYTVPCCVPQCSDMARCRPGQAASNIFTTLKGSRAYCAVHDGSIAEFSTLGSRISRLEDFKKLYATGRDRDFLKKAVEKLSVTSSDDLSAYSQYKSLESFDLIPLRHGRGPALVFVNGFLSEGTANFDEWLTPLRDFFPGNTCYGLTWDAGGIKLFRHIQKLETTFAGLRTGALEGVRMGLQRGFRWGGAPLMAGAAGIVAATLSAALAYWKIAEANAERSGKVLAEVLARTDHPEGFILLGHSLGAGVICHALNELGRRECSAVKDVFMLGGAVGNGGDVWQQALRGLRGRVHNVYSTQDCILRYLYKASKALLSEPVGLSGISPAQDNVCNLDASSFVDGHTKHKQALGKIMTGFSSLEIQEVTMAEEPNMHEHAKEYSPESFWDKLTGFAKSIGCEGVRNALRLYYVLESPDLPMKYKAIIYGALGYLISPVDVIPDIIPVVGFTDDIAVIASALAVVTMHITPEIKAKADAKLADWFGVGEC